MQVPAPATQIQQHQSANGEEKGRTPAQGRGGRERGGTQSKKQHTKTNNTGKYLIESQSTFVAECIKLCSKWISLQNEI